MARYRVLFVNHVAGIAGGEKATLRWLDALDGDLFEVAWACPEEGPLTEYVRQRGMAVYLGYPSERLLNIRRKSLGSDRRAVLAYPVDMAVTVIRLARLIREERFDLVFTNSLKADIYGSLAGRLARRPVVWGVHDVVIPGAFSRLNMWLVKNCARYLASRIIADAPAVKEALLDLGVREEKVPVIFIGIEMDEVRSARSREEVRGELGLDEEAPVAAFVGRLVEWKGVDYFIRAAAEAAERVPQARFLVVGDALFGEEEYVHALRRLAAELRMEDRVVFTGFREDVPDIMSSVDVFVLSSVLPDPLPNVVIEAMAKGLPVVAFDGGGIPVMIEDGVTGVIVPTRDYKAMAGAMAELLGDRDRARRMGEAGSIRAQRIFDKRETARAKDRVLLEALEWKGR